MNTYSTSIPCSYTCYLHAHKSFIDHFTSWKWFLSPAHALQAQTWRSRFRWDSRVSDLYFASGANKTNKISNLEMPLSKIAFWPFAGVMYAPDSLWRPFWLSSAFVDIRMKWKRSGELGSQDNLIRSSLASHQVDAGCFSVSHRKGAWLALLIWWQLNWVVWTGWIPVMFYVSSFHGFFVLILLFNISVGCKKKGCTSNQNIYL